MATPQPAPRLRLGSIAPNFKADTTAGPIDFHEYIGDGWVVFFSHPEDYTPVCTTELGAFAALEPEFKKRGVKLIGLSANTVDSHTGWVSDIKDISGNTVGFPIIADKQRQVAYLYDMLDYQDTTNVDEKGIVSCPRDQPKIGRNFTNTSPRPSRSGPSSSSTPRRRSV
jgi:alkyl hydroperoxide reductase subunit AhpC